MTAGTRAIAAIVCMLALANEGCDSPPIRPPERVKTARTLVLVGDSEDSPLYPVLIGAATAFRLDRPEIAVRVIAPEQLSPVLQQQMLNELASGDDDAVCVIPIDDQAIGPTLNRLAAAGKPVVTALRDAPSSRRIAYSGAAELDIGQKAANAAIDALAGRSRSVVILRADAYDAAYRGRYTAALDALTRSTTAQLMDEVDCDGNPHTALQLVRNMTRKFPRVGAWVFLDDWPMRVLEPRERVLPIGCALVVCADKPELFPRLRSGEIQALVTTDLHAALVRGLEVAYLLAEGEREDRLRTNPLPAQIITLDEIDWHEARWAAWRKGQPSPPKPRK